MKPHKAIARFAFTQRNVFIFIYTFLIVCGFLCTIFILKSIAENQIPAFQGRLGLTVMVGVIVLININAGLNYIKNQAGIINWPGLWEGLIIGGCCGWISAFLSLDMTPTDAFVGIGTGASIGGLAGAAAGRISARWISGLGGISAFLGASMLPSLLKISSFGSWFVAIFGSGLTAVWLAFRLTELMSSGKSIDSAKGMLDWLVGKHGRQASKELEKSSSKIVLNSGPELTERQLEVLKLADEGQTYKQIGSKLRIEERTVKEHVAQARSRLGAKNVRDAIKKARESGFL